MKRKIFYLILLFIFVASCSKSKRHPVIKLFKKNNSIILGKNTIDILFNKNELEEVKVFSKKKFTEYNLVFTPLRKFNLKNSLSVYLNYLNGDNYIRLDMFLNNGKIHLYQKRNGKVGSFLYTEIRPLFNILENNVYSLNIKNRKLSLAINNQIIFSEKINFTYGKVGIGAYGKKGDQVKFVFK